ncbi:MAG: ABC transporter ATP-binding protein [Planctomycetes bacterium]|nr:ABC transporter ATP-binding protein [Planctomycetota bacterium]
MSTSQNTLISLEDVHKTYRLSWGELTVLKGVTLRINKGDFIAIMGPSGSGKSTLLNILGLLDKPSKGVYTLNGQNTTEFSDDELSRFRNKSIGFIFQYFNLFSQLTAIQNVEVPMEYAGVSRGDRKKRAAALLEKVGIGSRMDHKPTQLSGGEMQRVAIARSLSNNPSFLLADEPTGNLDEASGEKIVNVLKELSREGITIVVVTHNPLVAQQTHKIYRMKDGALLNTNVDVNGM